MPVLRGWDEELFESWAQRKVRRAAEAVAARTRIAHLDPDALSEEDFLLWLSEQAEAEACEERRTDSRTSLLKRQRAWIARRLAFLKETE